ncbi:E3 ubiquitin-protein ligase rnf4 [Boothiomyces macroporosus]|uniref:E3 ubiquitin-protein ligase rnf4 n=1 Tax=Boothiomyces macroporosus TaxID=261099 RepID=A0AAD5Y777_9FUNG|nr:E3 ubiquitin-protein ligase rnf4 [Boothiomyces macroporosus]
MSRTTPIEIIDLDSEPTPPKKRRFNDDAVTVISETRKESRSPDVEITQVIEKPRRMDSDSDSDRELHPQHRFLGLLFDMYDRPAPQPRTTVLPPPPPAEPEMTPAMLKCAVCQNLASKETQLCATMCGHVFCEECLLESLKHTKNCPTCRKKISKKGYHKIFI